MTSIKVTTNLENYTNFYCVSMSFSVVAIALFIYYTSVTETKARTEIK